MATCANCGAELRPEWRFCVFCGAPTSAEIASPAVTGATRRINPLAILALVLACIGGFPALIFGHLAIRQIRESGERGMLIARIATVLGYVWLAVTIVLVVNGIIGTL